MIRVFTENDYDALIAIFKLNTPKFFDPNEQKDFETYLKDYAAYYFVIELDGKIAGGGGLKFQNDKKIVRISWDLLHPDFQSRGLGSELLRHRLNWLGEHMDQHPNLQKIESWTSQVSVKFYEKFGFVTREIKKNFWGAGLDLYLTEKAFSGS
ncbi:GNAT family N-acetyltransferase [bacterium]|nr:GNAT family N-acetyltransferase [bacterium]